MNIETKLVELQRRRDAALAQMDDHATHLGRYLRAWYSPANVLRRHIGPAMGVAATLGTLVGGITPGEGLFQLLWAKLLSRRHVGTEPIVVKTSQTTDTSAPPHHVVDGDNKSAGPDTPSRRTDSILDVAEPIVKNLIVGVAQAIPWRSIMGRVWEKRDMESDRADQHHKGPSGL